MSKIALRLSGVTKIFGKQVRAVDDLSLEIEEGEFFGLLGPSGCGKTTTLRLVAGLETPDDGRDHFEDRVVVVSATGDCVPPEKRNMGMVFQSYAIWPHMTVFENVAYPLRAAPRAAAEIRERVGRRAGAGRAGRARRAPGAAAQRRPAAARGARPRARLRARASCCSTSRSATSTPSCASRCASRSSCCRSGSDHRALRDPRPGRGAEPLRPHRA